MCQQWANREEEKSPREEHVTEQKGDRVAGRRRSLSVLAYHPSPWQLCFIDKTGKSFHRTADLNTTACSTSTTNSGLRRFTRVTGKVVSWTLRILLSGLD
ncbi:hypothetical protein SRHO_G00149570 [Serrasalmus rhombeus]